MGAYTNFIGAGVAVNGAPLVPGGGNLPLTGNYWYVNSGTGSDGNPGTWDSPLATLGQAITNASANTGDVIVLQEGHAQTISAAGGITVNKAGVYIIGLGTGSKRPTFTFGTSTAATFLISAANVTVANIVGTNTLNAIVSPFSVTGANCQFGLPGQPVEWQDSATNVEALRAVLFSAAATGGRVVLRYLGQTGGSACVNAVRFTGPASGAYNGSCNCDFYGKFSTACVEFVTNALPNMEVTGYMYNSGTTDGSKNVVDTATGSTWSANFYDGAAAAFIQGGSALPIKSANTTPGAMQSYITAKTIASASATLTTGASPVTLFTVTGDIIARVWATVQTGITSTLNNGTLAVGVSGATTAFLGATTMDGTQFATGTVWAGATSGNSVKALVFSNTALNWAPLAGGATIICTVATNSATAGAITFYCEWVPISNGAQVVGN